MDAMKRGTLPLLLAITAWSGVPEASASLRYMAGLHQSSWSVSGSPLSCTMRHEIPLFGEAVFSRRAGEALAFTLESRRPAWQPATVRLASIPPAWMHDAESLNLGWFTLSEGARSLQFGQTMSRRLLQELEQGRFAAFTYPQSASEAPAAVILSAVNLRPALPEFLQCLEAVLPYGFDKVRESRLFFGFDSDRLTSEARRRLEQVARYLKADERIRQVRLDGYADNVGYRRYNAALSRRRAERVRDFLVTQGVAAERIVIKVHGEQRSKNPASQRRVEVTLLR